MVRRWGGGRRAFCVHRHVHDVGEGLSLQSAARGLALCWQRWRGRASGVVGGRELLVQLVHDGQRRAQRRFRTLCLDCGMLWAQQRPAAAVVQLGGDAWNGRQLRGELGHGRAGRVAWAVMAAVGQAWAREAVVARARVGRARQRMGRRTRHGLGRGEGRGIALRGVALGGEEGRHVEGSYPGGAATRASWQTMVQRAPLTEAMGARQSCWGGRGSGLDVQTQLSDAAPMVHSARKAGAGCGLDGSRSDSATRGGGTLWSSQAACAGALFCLVAPSGLRPPPSFFRARPKALPTPCPRPAHALPTPQAISPCAPANERPPAARCPLPAARVAVRIALVLLCRLHGTQCSVAKSPARFFYRYEDWTLSQVKPNRYDVETVLDPHAPCRAS
jgi:hypothetical protein